MRFPNLFLRCVLFALSGVYRFFVVYRNRRFDAGKRKVACFPVKIIAVGNLTLGGAGKTPMAAYIIETLRAKGFRVAYLSRGYGRKTKGFRLFVVGQTSVTEIGDEAYQIAMRFPAIPVAVCEKRTLGAQILLERFALDYIVLDDAFQHRQIARNLNIVMIDASRPPYQDALFPLGRLREPLESLKRADVICINKCLSWEAGKQIENELRKNGLSPLTPIFYARYLVQEPIAQIVKLSYATLEEMRNVKAILISALANNQSFEELLIRVGIPAFQKLFYPDHYFYREKDVRRLYLLYQEAKAIYPETCILTTEKDAVKLKQLVEKNRFYQDLPIFVIRVQLAFYQKPEEFEQLLFDTL